MRFFLTALPFVFLAAMASGQSTAVKSCAEDTANPKQMSAESVLRCHFVLQEFAFSEGLLSAEISKPQIYDISYGDIWGSEEICDTDFLEPSERFGGCKMPFCANVVVDRKFYFHGDVRILKTRSTTPDGANVLGDHVEITSVQRVLRIQDFCPIIGDSDEAVKQSISKVTTDGTFFCQQHGPSFCSISLGDIKMVDEFDSAKHPKELVWLRTLAKSRIPSGN